MNKKTNVEVFNTCRQLGLSCPRDFWTLESAREVLKYLYDKGTVTDKILKTLGMTYVLRSNGLDTVTHFIYKDLNATMDFVTSGKVKAWELLSISQKYWDDENNVISYISWFLEKNGIKYEEVPKKFRYCKTLRTVRQRYTKEEIIKIAFKKDYNIYDFYIEKSYFDDIENVKDYVRYILKKNNLITREEIAKGIKAKLFKRSLIEKFSLVELVELVMPDTFSVWEIDSKGPSNVEELKDYLQWYSTSKGWGTDLEILSEFKYFKLPLKIRRAFTIDEIVSNLCYGDYYIWEFSQMQKKWTSEIINKYVSYCMDNKLINKNNIKTFGGIHGSSEGFYHNYDQIMADVKTRLNI